MSEQGTIFACNIKHATHDEVQRMDDDELFNDISVWGSDNGYMFYIGEKVSFMGQPLSRSLRGAIDRAQQEGATYLMLVYKGPTLPNLAIHNWN